MLPPSRPRPLPAVAPVLCRLLAVLLSGLLPTSFGCAPPRRPRYVHPAPPVALAALSGAGRAPRVATSEGPRPRRIASGRFTLCALCRWRT